MNALLFIYALALFFVLTPNVLVKIPMKGSKYLVAAVHALIFAIVWIFTYKFLVPVTGKAHAIEGMTPSASSNSYNIDILTALLTGYKNNNPAAVKSVNEILQSKDVQAQIQAYKNQHPIPVTKPTAPAVQPKVASA